MGKPPSPNNEAPPAWHSGQENAWAQNICAIAAGDAVALARLYDESASILYSLAFRMLGNSPDAEEVVSDVFCQVLRCAPTWDPVRGSSSAWLIMLCRNLCIDKIRSRSARPAVEESFDSGSFQPFSLSEAPGRANIVGQTAVLHALDRLDRQERELLELAFFSGLTHMELSERLQLPPGTVKGRIRRAIANLRDLVRGFAT